MKILIHALNYSPELTGIGKYSGEMARWYAEQGHDVRVITAPPYYPGWKVHEGFSHWRYSSYEEDGVKVFRCPLYVPSRPTALKRILHLISFSFSSSLVMLAQSRWKPELVVLLVPTLFCAPQTLLLAKLSRAISVAHIHDFEVDAMFGLGMAKGNRLKRFSYAMEKMILRAFDRVSTVSRSMLARAEKKGVDTDKLRFFPNWSETQRFHGVSRNNDLLTRLGVDPARKVILYSGNIGEKQGLENVIEVARKMSDRSELAFLIVGEGAGKSRLVDLARQYNLDNVTFSPLLPYDDLPLLLATADCHLIIQKSAAADAVLPSKLTNILAVGGNAVITAEPDTDLGKLCSEYPGIAVRIEPESIESLVSGIETALGMSEHNSVATRYASEFLDKDRVLNRFLVEI